MEEDFGALFGYNYRRRILINLKNRKKRLREKVLIMERNNKLQEERKKREALVVYNYLKKKEEQEIIKIPEYEEVSIDNKNQLAEVLKEGLVLLLQELRLIKNIEINKGIKDSISTDDLIKEVEEDINNINYIKGDGVITKEEEGIIYDLLYDNSIELIIEDKKKNIGLNLDKKTISNWIEFDDEVEMYDEFIKGNIEELQVIDKELDNKITKGSNIKDAIDKGFNKSYKILMTLSISTKKERPMDKIVGINKGLSLMRDIVNPNISVKEYHNYGIQNFTKELERCYMDPSYCRLFIHDSKRIVYEIAKELKKQRDIVEYRGLYDKLVIILDELDKEEKYLNHLIQGKEKENNRVYIKEMDDYEQK